MFVSTCVCDGVGVFVSGVFVSGVFESGVFE